MNKIKLSIFITIISLFSILFIPTSVGGTQLSEAQIQAQKVYQMYPAEILYYETVPKVDSKTMESLTPKIQVEISSLSTIEKTDVLKVLTGNLDPKSLRITDPAKALALSNLTATIEPIYLHYCNHNNKIRKAGCSLKEITIDPKGEPVLK